MDRPGGRKMHPAPVPTAGGLAVFLAFQCACAVVFLVAWQPFAGQLTLSWWLRFLPLSTSVVALGLIDDRYSLRSAFKLSGQALIALAAYLLGMRVQNVLGAPLPAAIHQAHERLIGDRQVQNSEKILSLYEPNVHVIVRGKAGAAVGFGNGLYLAERTQGLIVDWEFVRDQPPADGAHVKSSLARIQKNYAAPLGYATDRGFHSKANCAHLEKHGIFDAICPKAVGELQERRAGRCQARPVPSVRRGRKSAIGL